MSPWPWLLLLSLLCQEPLDGPDGHIFTKDKKLALAYILVAKHQGMESRAMYMNFMSPIEEKLTLQEAGEAKQVARRLCGSLCGPLGNQ